MRMINKKQASIQYRQELEALALTRPAAANILQWTAAIFDYVEQCGELPESLKLPGKWHVYEGELNDQSRLAALHGHFQAALYELDIDRTMEVFDAL